MPRAIANRLWAWSALGLAGSLLVAVTAPRAISDPVVGWWYGSNLALSRTTSVVLVWVGMGLLASAWLAIASGRAGAAPVTRAQATLIALVWLIPIVLGPPLFSRDVYSYLAQGTILHLGGDPYRQQPTVLASLHHAHLLAAVSSSWRHTTAPYGPLFLEAISLIVGLTGRHLVAGVLACRALDLIGLGLLALSLPRLARATGADAGRAVWLAVAGPLTILAIVAPAHNDLLMVGLVVAGVTLALGGRPLTGIAVCALAATIKVPALVAAVFIAVAWARSEPAAAARIRLLAAAAALVAGVLAAVTLAAGTGVGWLSSSVFSTPAHAHLVLTPAIALSRTLAEILGSTVSGHGLETACELIATALVAVIGARLLWRVRVATLVPLLGVTLILAAVGGPAAWPWYLAWGLALLSGAPNVQRSPSLAAILVAGAFLVAPDGVVVVPGGAAPIVLAVYCAAGLIVVWRRRVRGPAARRRPASDVPLSETIGRERDVRVDAA